MRTNIPYSCALLLSILSATIATNSWSQIPTENTLQEAESRLRGIYERGEFRAKQFRADWLPDSTGYTVAEPAPDGKNRVLVRYDVVSGERTVLETPQRQTPGGLGNVSPDGQSVLFSEQGDLYVRDLRGDRKTRLTYSAADSAISNNRAAWSPDGKWIVFVQSDESHVRLRPILIPSDPTYPEVKKVRFARVGGTIPTLRIGVVDALGKETRWLSVPIPSEGFYLGQVEWAGNSHELLIEKLSRFRDEREFLLVDVRTGAMRRIFHESDPAWVVASYETNGGLMWIRDGQAFIVLSEKDGWRHAYVYSRDGRELALLTPGAYDIIARAVVDEAGGWFYFYASPDNATQKYLYRVRLDATAEPERVTPADQPGTHDYDFSPDAKWAFHTYSTFDTPPVVELVQLPEHRVVRVLEDNGELRQKMASVISQPTEFFQIEIGQGVVMDAWMIKPTNFDPSKKYPRICLRVWRTTRTDGAGRLGNSPCRLPSPDRRPRLPGGIDGQPRHAGTEGGRVAAGRLRQPRPALHPRSKRRA